MESGFRRPVTAATVSVLVITLAGTWAAAQASTPELSGFPYATPCPPLRKFRGVSAAATVRRGYGCQNTASAATPSNAR